MRVLARDRSQDAERGGDGVAAALDGEPDDVLRIEIDGIGSERRRARVLDPLVDRQNREIAGPAQPAGGEDALQAHEDLWVTIGASVYAVHEIGAREVQLILGDPLAGEAEQRLRLVIQQIRDQRHRLFRLGLHYLPLFQSIEVDPPSLTPVAQQTTGCFVDVPKQLAVCGADQLRGIARCPSAPLQNVAQRLRFLLTRDQE